MDLILTYVDSSDINWKNIYTQYKEYTNNTLFNNYNTLQYTFRSIEAYLPFIDTVHLIVQQESQIPSWLNKSNPKLKIHYHDEFIPKEFLPTFNSTLIEAFFHKIEDLANEFIYINDDMFFGKMCQPTDFFINGLPVDSNITTDKAYSNPDLINKKCTTKHMISLQNSIDLINRITGMKCNYFKNYHTCCPYLKEDIISFYEKYEKEILDTYKNKFMFRNLYNFKLWSYRWIRLINNRYIENNDLYESETKYWNIKNVKDINQLNYKCFCINEGNCNVYEHLEHIQDLLKIKYQNKSRFEL